MDNHAQNGSDDLEHGHVEQVTESILANEQPESLQQSTHWQRLSPIAILYFIAKSVLSIARSSIYMLPLVAINFNDIKDNPYYFIVGVSTLLGMVIIASILKYLFYSFRLSEQHVEIKQGIFQKSHTDLPFSRIQNVKLEQPLYYRWHQFTCLQLDTAGSAEQEAKIVALPVSVAEAFKQQILIAKRKEETASEIPRETAPITDEKVLNTRSIKDLVIHGVSNNRVWLLLGFLAPFYNTLTKGAATFFGSIGFDVKQFFSLETQAWWEFALHVISLAMLLMLIMISFSILGAIIAFYRYTLSKLDDRYIRRSGLFTRQEVSMKLSRIQLVVQEQDWLDVLLRRVNLKFEQNASFGGKNSQATAMVDINKLIVPSITKDESAALIDDALVENQFASIKYKSISKRFITRLVILYVVPSLIFLFYLGEKNGFFGLMIASAVSALMIGVIVLRWFRWGFNYDKHYVYLRKGLFGINYYCFPIYKIQQTKLRQSIFMRRHHLSSINFVLASGGLTLPYVSEQACKTLINQALLQVESEKRSWM